jgi:hypothetical protein
MKVFFLAALLLAASTVSLRPLPRRVGYSLDRHGLIYSWHL